MKLAGGPAAVDWPSVPISKQAGVSGVAEARVHQFGDAQIRLVSYGPDYVSDHWCHKGHIVFVVDGMLIIEHRDGQRYELAAGMSYHVGDDEGSPHRVISRHGASIFIVD
jgi:hypothetical protein